MKMVQFILLLLFLLMISTVNAQQWKIYADSARSFALQKNNEKASTLFTHSSDLLKKDSSSSWSLFNLLNEAGEFYYSSGQYAKAVAAYTEFKTLAEKLAGKNSAEYAGACNNLGRSYRTVGKYQESENLLIEGKNIREQLFGKENADYASSCNNLAVLYLEVGMYAEAAPLYDEALQIRKRVLGKDHIDYAASCNNLAILYVVTGKPELAEPLYLEAKNIRERVLGRQHPFYAASCNNLAALYLDMGQYMNAERLYLEAKEVRASSLGKNHPDYASSCDNLAILYMDLGNYRLAESLYMEAREIRGKTVGKMHQEYAKGSNNLGLLYKNLGQYERALELLSEARSVLGSALGSQHFEYAKSCNNLGALYMDMGEYTKAAPLYEEARSIGEKVLGKEHPEYAKSCHNLALINRHEGRLDLAKDLFIESLKIREKVFGKMHPEYAAGCDNLGVLYADMNEMAKATSMYLEARHIKKQILGESHPDFLQTSINLANLYRRTGDHDSASIFFKEAFQSQQSLVKNIFHFTTEPEKQAYLRKVNEYRDYFLSYSTSAAPEPLPEYAYNVSLANRNIILSSSQQLKKIVFESNDSILASKYNEWIAAREQLAFWYSRPVNLRKGAVKEKEEQMNYLEKELIQRSIKFGTQINEVLAASIRQSLKPGEAAIEFLQFNYHNGQNWTDSVYYMAVVQKYGSSKPELVHLFEKRALDSLLGNIASSPGTRGIPLLYKHGLNKKGSLYDLIWKPLERSLGNSNKVYFSPAGELYKISFAALPVSPTQTLSDKLNLVQLNTTASVVNEKDYPFQQGEILLYGGVKYDAAPDSIRRAVMKFTTNDVAKNYSRAILPSGSDFHYLAQTENEIKSIDKLARNNNISVSLASGIGATEESLKALSLEANLQSPSVLKHSPGILHIATHGFFFPDPPQTQTGISKGMSVFRYSVNPLIRSGLAFAGANNAWSGNPVDGVEDGILTAYEVSNLYLPNTQLAVLSACETGLGNVQGSEGVYGLQRAFRMASVDNLVMSLWKVPDAETSEFMQEFYRNLFNMQTIMQAFDTTQSSMRRKYRNDPYKWAAWILVR